MTDWKAYDEVCRRQEKALANDPAHQQYMKEYRAIVKRIHDYIGQADDHTRGYYLGLAKALCYAQAQVRGRSGPITIDMPLDDAGFAYSPSGEQRHAEHFYSETPPPAPDLVTHHFDPVMYYCILSEIDSEGGIMAVRFDIDHDGAWSSVKISVATTEDDHGVPDGFEQSWDELVALRDRIRKLASAS